MSYATLDDLETRYPGELAQAGPKTPSGLLDEDAVDLALIAADEAIDRALRVIGWTVPLTAPVPAWVVALAVDLALYAATPTVLASQDDFKDRRVRYDAALATLEDIAAGRLLPAPPTGATGSGVYVSSRERQFGRGSW
jgi:phage gp36-like protein